LYKTTKASPPAILRKEKTNVNTARQNKNTNTFAQNKIVKKKLRLQHKLWAVNKREKISGLGLSKQQNLICNRALFYFPTEQWFHFTSLCPNK